MDHGAAGLAASLATALAAALPASLAIAAGAAADAAASGAGAEVSSDLLQAEAKNIVTSAKSRNLRIAFSLGVERGRLKRGNNTIGAG